jgi:peptidoglycan/LPS O-acetylase OafA/YrhL
LALFALLVIASLIPAKWQYLRTGLGWQTDHFVGFFVATSVVCLAWPRPLLVGPILMATAALLEGLQALTPDRVPNFEAALYGAGGTLVAVPAALVIHLWKRRAGGPQKSK